MENAFTECFSLLELHCDSILDILSVVKAKQQCELGCSDHCKAVAAEVTAFYLTTRIHFYIKSINRSNAKRRQSAKYAKLGKCA